MSLHPRLQLLLFDSNLSSPTLVDDLTDRVDKLKFSTALHGGFKTCTFTLSTTLGEAWQWLSRAGELVGRHFFRIVLYEEQVVRWEGRVMDIRLNINPRQRGLDITALGYWNACRDQFYDAADGGNTDWTAGGPHNVDDIIREMLTNECPDISTTHTNIDVNVRDVAGIDLTARAYPQDIIVDRLATLADSSDVPWYFGIWEDRLPHWHARAAADNWQVWLADIESLRLTQAATHLRNAITPVVGSTEGTVETNATSLLLYPRRELILTVHTGANANTQSDAAQTAANERADPKQSENFVITGPIYDVRDNQLIETHKWRVRAGDTIRIQDLVPDSAGAIALEGLRTFFILETSYDADRDSLAIQPDTFARNLSGLLPRLGSIERGR